MNTLQIRTPASEKPERQLAAAPTLTVPGPARRPSDEAPMTHAWSIGTTRLAQEPAPALRMAYCPPEVYIG